MLELQPGVTVIWDGRLITKDAADFIRYTQAVTPITNRMDECRRCVRRVPWALEYCAACYPTTFYARHARPYIDWLDLQCTI